MLKMQKINDFPLERPTSPLLEELASLPPLTSSPLLPLLELSPKRAKREKYSAGDQHEKRTKRIHERTRSPRDDTPPSFSCDVSALLLKPRHASLFEQYSEKQAKKLFKKEFKKLVEQGESLAGLSFEEKQKRFPTACSFKNWSKNRYVDVLADEHTRVVLKYDEGADLERNFDFSRLGGDIFGGLGEEAQGGCSDDYINANYICESGSSNPVFIATQAPLESTVNDYFQMIFQTKSKCLISLSSVIENNKIKMFQFWPRSRRQPFTTASFSLSLDQESTPHPGITVRHLTLVNNSITDDNVVRIVHIHYLDWPDNDIPQNHSSLLEIHRLNKQFREQGAKEGLEGPTIVNCSAGVGRTGTFIATAMLVDKVDANKREGLSVVASVDVPGTVAELRKQRTGMVANWKQYFLIYSIINSYLQQIQAC